jgi:hypothetical protein
MPLEGEIVPVSFQTGWNVMNSVNGQYMNANAQTDWLPAAGYFDNVALSTVDRGTAGYYWTGTFQSQFLAKRLNFTSTAHSIQTNSNQANRLPVRCVRQ